MKNRWIKDLFKLIIAILIIFIVFIGFRIFKFRKNMISDIRVNNNVVEDKLPYEPEKIDLVEVNSKNERPIKEVVNLEVKYNGEKLTLTSKLYEKNLRYYFNISDLLKQMKIKFNLNNNELLLDNGTLVDLKNREITKNNVKKSLRGEILQIENNPYISLNDLEYILSLRDHWDVEKNCIYLFNEKKDLTPLKENSGGTKKAALIRLEDVTATGLPSNSENIEKLKILGDFLYSQDVKFHIAWVPRYINPGENVDNNLLNNDSINNVQFINMLDHMIYRGATIGLHGYTHQHGDTVSTAGNEMGITINNTEKDTRNIAENALTVAKTLNIPIAFFESPHYHATRKQQKILSEYFNILYEPYTGYWNMKPLIDPENKSTLYIPAPLGYVKDENGQHLCKEIKKFPDWILSSLFVHPFKELGFITIDKVDDNGYVNYSYDNNSPMQNIVRTLKETNHQTITVNELK